MDERPADERATLEELERLQQQIRRYRSRREAVADEFDQFVRSFGTPREAPVAPAAELTPALRKAASPLGQPAQAPREAATPSIVEPTAAPSPFIDETLAPSSRVDPPAPAPAPQRQAGLKTGVLIGGALALLAGSALVTWMLLPRAPEPSSTTDAAAAVAPPLVPAAREGPPPAAAATESELTTSRTVWVRLTVDGERVLERELPPNAHVPLKAEKTIVIRTGDAGAIRVTLRGQDKGLLGRAGEVVTRTFTVPR